jgi:hypothetical protein
MFDVYSSSRDCPAGWVSTGRAHRDVDMCETKISLLYYIVKWFLIIKMLLFPLWMYAGIFFSRHNDWCDCTVWILIIIEMLLVALCYPLFERICFISSLICSHYLYNWSFGWWLVKYMQLNWISLTKCFIKNCLLSSRMKSVLYYKRLMEIRDRLCVVVVRVLGYWYRGPGSIPGATRFSEM